jgi:transposase-like protein
MASSALQRGWRVDETYVKVRGVWAYLGKYTFNWLKTLV